NTLSLSLAEGYLEYVPKARFCELILDGIYYGVHSLTERVRIGGGRLDIKNPGQSGDKLTGGYIVCIDRNDEPLTHASKYHPTNSAGEVFTDKTIWMQYTDPSCDDITEEQRAYIDSRFDDFEDALASDDFMDADRGYRQHIDVSSFIDYQLSTEIANNIDGYRLSTYLYKHRDSVDPRFKMTLWDFDMAWGLPDFENIHTGYMTDIWTYKNNDAGLGTKMPFWFDRLMQDPAYVAELKARYALYREGRYADVPAVVDSLATLLTAGGAADRDHMAWPRWGEVIYQNYYLDATTYAEEVAYVRRFAAARIAWLDEQLGYAPAAIASPSTRERSQQTVWSAGGIMRGSLQPGLNIVRFSDGTVRKIWRK
ncbi:MAG: CotH kinase family protein, partial [Candidatus Cryptobacteroides sp.]|nr:CotH kinase family protein [Candidatus Cryptobacteroides sp.]